MQEAHEIDEGTVDAVSQLKNDEFSAEDVAKIQEQMFNLGMLGQKPKTSGGNKFHASASKRATRRTMQKASRKVNRPKK